MAITRREVTGILAACVSVPAVAAPQEDSSEETRSAHEALRNNALQLDRVPLPMATEPDFQFKA